MLVALSLACLAGEGRAAEPYTCGSLQGATYRIFIEGLYPFIDGRRDLHDGRGCKTEECRAAADLMCASGAMIGFRQPNTMGFRTPQDAYVNEMNNMWTLQTFGHRHPRRIPLYCRMLAMVAASATGDPKHDEYGVATVVDLALRLHPYRPSCTAEVKAAFPDTDAMRADLPHEVDACVFDPHPCPRTQPPLLRPDRHARRTR